MPEHSLSVAFAPLQATTATLHHRTVGSRPRNVYYGCVMLHVGQRLRSGFGQWRDDLNGTDLSKGPHSGQPW